MDQWRENARQADTEDLLDRVTVFRKGMAPEALEVFEAELRRRGIRQDAIDAHLVKRAGEVIWLEDGIAARCTSYDSRYTVCHRPAIGCQGGWQWLSVWGIRLVPLFPRTLYFCSEHQPVRPGPSLHPRE